MRIQYSPNVPAGQLYLMADIDHPEILLFLDQDLGDVDGTVLVAHPDDREAAERLLARVGEHGDPNEILTRWRKRR